MQRTIIVSNRLPVTAAPHEHDVRLEPSTGGLATGLWPVHQSSGGVWIGWPSDVPKLDRAQRKSLDAALAAERIIPVTLTRREVSEYYDAVSNGVLWPVFQYLIERLPSRMTGWETYRSVNEKFARVVAEHYQPGDRIWVHDYQLVLVPRMVRQLVPDARIGFFLHIPFPSDEVFSILPWREEILHGLLGADLIGFHTASYVRHFATSLRRILGLEPDLDRVRVDGREVAFGAFPMGIDARAWDERARDDSVREAAETIRRDAGGRSILLGIDRLDYTKGIPRRLLALQKAFEDDVTLPDQVRFVQVTVPSREKVEAYASFRRRVDELIGEINGSYSTTSAVPIHRMHQSLSRDEIVALYSAADVMLVTSLRDGMNLVAKEFVASRYDEDGVLILSEFAGAAAELGDAVIVNPYDIDGMAKAIRAAISMPADEKRRRMRAMRARVMEHDVHRWVRAFLARLGELSADEHPCPASSVGPIARRLRGAEDLMLVLDYDGTLVPIVADPDDAAPDEKLLDLLRRLAARSNTHVHVVSGRAHQTIERWLGHLPIGLHAEHGLWTRPERGGAWRQTHAVPQAWKDRVRPVLEHFVETTPGSMIEEKSASLVWHYRNVGRHGDGLGEARARELRTTLADLLSNAPIEVRAAKKAVELRPQGVHKGTVLAYLLEEHRDPVTVVAIGDDDTDEDLFAAVPAGGVTIHVGGGETRAEHRFGGPEDVHRLLRHLVAVEATVPEPVAASR